MTLGRNDVLEIESGNLIGPSFHCVVVEVASKDWR